MKSGLALFLSALLLGGCTQTAPAKGHEYSTPTPQPAEAGFNQSLALNGVTITPLSLVEDSRCPINAMCVWQGRLIISARIARDGREEDVRLSLKEPKQVLGRTITLETALPSRQSGVEIAAEDYRFSFSGG